MIEQLLGGRENAQRVGYAAQQVMGELARIREALHYAHGRPPSSDGEVAPASRGTLPTIASGALADGATATVDAESQLGRVAVVSRIENLGGNPLRVFWRSSSTGDWTSAPYWLPPNATREIPWHWAKVELTATNGATEYQVVMQ